MAFKTGIIVKGSDADPAVHRASVKMAKVEFITVAVRGGDLDQAMDVCRAMVRDEGVKAFFLAPGFTYEEVAGIKNAVGPDISVSITRADFPDTMIALKLLMQEGIIPPES